MTKKSMTREEAESLHTAIEQIAVCVEEVVRKLSHYDSGQVAFVRQLLRMSLHAVQSARDTVRNFFVDGQ